MYAAALIVPSELNAVQVYQADVLILFIDKLRSGFPRILSLPRFHSRMGWGEPLAEHFKRTSVSGSTVLFIGLTKNFGGSFSSGKIESHQLNTKFDFSN